MIEDKIGLEILSNRFQAIVDEMAQALFRTAHTVFIKETQDYGAVLVSPGGEVFAASRRYGVLMMVGMPMDDAVKAMGDDVREGDIFMTNDPEATGGMCTHLNDVFLWKPIFHDGKLICYAWTFVHMSDVGGRVSGSIAPSSYEIYQEGIRVPPQKLFREGVLDQTFLKMFLVNTRTGEQNWGDMKACIAGRRSVENRSGAGSIATRVSAAPIMHLLRALAHRVGQLLALLNAEHGAHIQHRLRHALAGLVVPRQHPLAHRLHGRGVDRGLQKQVPHLLMECAALFMLRAQVLARRFHDLLDLAALFGTGAGLLKHVTHGGATHAHERHIHAWAAWPTGPGGPGGRPGQRQGCHGKQAAHRGRRESNLHCWHPSGVGHAADAGGCRCRHHAQAVKLREPGRWRQWQQRVSAPWIRLAPAAAGAGTKAARCASPGAG